MLMVLMFVLNIHFPIIPEFPMEAATGNGTTSTQQTAFSSRFYQETVAAEEEEGGRNELKQGAGAVWEQHIHLVMGLDK